MTRLLGQLCLGLCLLARASGGVHAQQAGPVFDDQIQIVTWEDLAYPLIAVSGRVEGTVVVSASLKDDGTVKSAEAISGTQAFIDVSVENVKKWTFVPNAQRKVVIIYVFNLEGTCVHNERSLFRLTQKNLAMITGCVRRIEASRGQPPPK